MADPDVKFLNDEEVDGINIVTDSDFVDQMRIKLGTLSKGSTEFFPVNWAFHLNQKNRKCLTEATYVVTPTPRGTRYLLYVESDRKIYLENQGQNFFRVSRDRTVQFLSPDTLLDGYFVRPISESDAVAVVQPKENLKGPLTFVIQDAIRCDGTELTGRGIVDRIAFTEVVSNTINLNSFKPNN